MKKAHNFTLKGKPVSCRELALHLGVVTQTVYDKARIAKSDVGEDIAAVLASRKKGGPKVEIWWNGEKTRSTEIAKELGIENATLLSRLRTFGENSFLTYWTGRIPRWLLLAHPGAKSENRGSDEYKKLSSRPRNHNLDRIKLGRWELSQCNG